MAKEDVSMADVLTLFQTMMEEQSKQQKEMLQTVVSEIRKPPVDPVKVAQKKREQETKEKANREYWERKLSKLKRCSHSRQDGTCVIGWAVQSDGKERGYCPNCDNLIGPELAEFGPEYLDIYAQSRKRPRGLMESVRYVA
jgi:hypothetical protein